MAVFFCDGAHGGPSGMRKIHVRFGCIIDNGVKNLIRSYSFTEIIAILSQFSRNRCPLVCKGYRCKVFPPYLIGKLYGTIHKIARGQPRFPLIIETPVFDLPFCFYQCLTAFEGEDNLYAGRIPSSYLQPVERIEKEVDISVLSESIPGYCFFVSLSRKVNNFFDIGQYVLFKGPGNIS